MAATDSELTISDAGGGNARRLPGVGSLLVSWEVNRAGLLTCLVPRRDVERAGLDPQLRGCWVQYDHPSAGRWGGVVTRAALVNGMVEVNAEGFASLFRKKIVTLKTGQNERRGTAGGLFEELVREQAADGAAPVTIGTIDRTGEVADLDFDDADFYDEVSPAFTTDLGMEWEVTPDRVVNYGARIGTDRNLLLIEGRHFRSARWEDDLLDVVNVAVGIAARRERRSNGSTRLRPERRTLTEPASVARFGRQEAAFVYGRVNNVSTIDRKLRLELDRYAFPKAAVTLEAVEPPGDRVFARFREGDAIQVELGLSGVRGGLRVMVRSLDVATGVMTIAGDGTEAA